jgi:hypothetical protein
MSTVKGGRRSYTEQKQLYTPLHHTRTQPPYVSVRRSAAAIERRYIGADGMPLQKQ